MTTIPTSAELVARAAALVPDLREVAAETEANRRVPDSSVKSMIDAGLYNVCKTKAFGGYELGWDALCDIAMTLAAGCPSTAWVFAVCAEHGAWPGSWPRPVLEEIWGETPDALISSGMMNPDKFEETEGGYRVTGTVTFSSGSDFADWFFCGMVGDGGMTGGLLIPKSDVEVLDTWHVMGLAGTGTHHLKLEDIFVPEVRLITRHGRNAPIVEDGGPISIARQHPFGPYSLASVVVGAAGGFIDQFVEQMKDRASRFGNKVAEFQSLQLRIAESAAEYEAARRLILANMRETMGYLAQGISVPPEVERRNKRDMGYAPTLAVRAVDRLFYAGGANFLFKTNELERQFRDVHAGSHQLALNWDICGTQFGRGALGLSPM